jgi:hypothetical protein
VNTTWWRTHPVGRRLLAVLVCELLLVVVPGPGPGSLLGLALDVWLVHLVRRGSRLAWAVLLGLAVLTAGLGVLALVVVGPGTGPVATLVLEVAVLALLLTPPVRGWVGRSGLLSLPGEH